MPTSFVYNQRKDSIPNFVVVKVLYVGKSSYHEPVIRNGLTELCEADSIHFVYSYAKAEEFISNNIINESKSLDLIICENNVGKNKVSEFLSEIKKDELRNYSNHDFLFKSVPVVLIADAEENEKSFKHLPITDAITNLGYEKLHLFVDHFYAAVKSWRGGVLDELENMGILSNSGQVDYDLLLRMNSKKETRYDAKILSDNFHRFPRRLNYLWMNFNEQEIMKGIDLYIKQMKIAKRMNEKRGEKKFHTLFKKYPFLIERDNYCEHWYEPRFYYEATKYFEPDFTLKPNFNQRTDLSLLEIKLPNEGFLKRTKFHASPYAKLMHHIFQVNDYKEYLESEKYHDHLKKVFGFVPLNVEYNLLIGRVEDKMENMDILNKRMNQMHMGYIKLLTYDELYDYQVKFFLRNKILTIV